MNQIRLYFYTTTKQVLFVNENAVSVKMHAMLSLGYCACMSVDPCLMQGVVLFMPSVAFPCGFRSVNAGVSDFIAMWHAVSSFTLRCTHACTSKRRIRHIHVCHTESAICMCWYCQRLALFVSWACMEVWIAIKLISNACIVFLLGLVMPVKHFRPLLTCYIPVYRYFKCKWNIMHSK